MKILLFPGLLLLSMTIACKKASPDSGLYGNWKLIQYTGGFSGIVIRPGPDSVCILSLQGDHGYKKEVKGVILESGTYSASPSDISFVGHAVPNGPTVPANPIVRIIEPFQLNTDTLFLGVAIADGPEYLYVRVK